MTSSIGKILSAGAFALLACGLEAKVTTSKPEDIAKLIPQETAEAKAKRLAWWTHDRFGMFIHFGLYALPGRHEWVKRNERTPEAEYQRYFDFFNPDQFDAKAWAKQAKAAGMKYAVLTTKHHEGFCLFDAHNTDYKATKTPFGRDIVREFVDAFRAEGIRIGFYYSLIDWHHPDFTWDANHPRYEKDAKGEPTQKVLDHNAKCNFANYLKYLHEQVEQLLTEYGRIDIMWFDFSYPWKDGKGRDDWDSAAILTHARKLQPWILVDNRLDLDDVPGGIDFVTPEQFKVSKWPTRNGVKVPWETCQTFSGSWGYHRDETSWKDERQLLELLIDTVARGGNLIMNIGPTGRGTIDYRAQNRLGCYAKWMEANSRAIYGCTEAPAEFKAPEGTVLTYNPTTQRLYIHLYNYPFRRLLFSFNDRVAYSQFLHDASEVLIGTIPEWDRMDDLTAPTKYFKIPVIKPPVEIPVIEVFLKEPAKKK